MSDMVNQRENVEIVLNGERREVGRGQKVAELLAELGLEGRRLAVMVNDEVVRKADYGQREIRAGDRLEIISMVGGG